jgi:hypothetical protein
MAMQYLIVRFPEDRGVMVDGRPAGTTNAVMAVEEGTCSISLEGAHDFSPASQTITIADTASFVDPKEITFEKIEPPGPWPHPPGARRR